MASKRRNENKNQETTEIGGGGGRQLSLDETSTWTPSTMTEVSSRQGSSGSLNTCLISDKRRHDRRRERLNTELLTAALNGDKDEVRRLLESGASPEATCRPQRVSACHVAALLGHAEVLGQLLTAGATGEERDRAGRQPVHLAAWAGHRSILELLHLFKPNLAKSPVVIPPDVPPIDMDISDSWSHNHDELNVMLPEAMLGGTTPLHLASKRVNKDCVDYLLSVDADVHCKDSEGLTPIDVAATSTSISGQSRPEMDDPGLAARMGALSGEDLEDLGEDGHGFSKPRAFVGPFRMQPRPAFRKMVSKRQILPRPVPPAPPTPSAPPAPFAAPELPSLDSGQTQDVIRALLEKGAKLPKANVILKEGSVINQTMMTVTTLHTAVAHQDLDLIDLLLSRDACMMTWNEYGDTALHLAVRLELLEPLKKMLCREVPWPIVDVRDIKGQTPLHLAVKQQWAEGVSFLLEMGADVKTTSNDSETVLHLAAERGNYDLLKELLSIPDSSKMLEYRNKLYFTPLGRAVVNNHLTCVELLCEYNADVSNGLPGDYSLVHIAAENNFPEIVSFLLRDRRVGYKLRDSRCRQEKGGLTPLHLAARAGHTPCVEELLKAGANLLLTTTEEPMRSSTALHLAAREGFVETVQTILDFDLTKQTLKATDEDKWYPLHVAAMNGHGNCVRVMLRHGADIAAAIPDETGLRSGLEIIMYCVPQAVEFLVEIFDSYIENNKRAINDPECEIEVKYDILIPEGTSKKQMGVLNELLNNGRQKLQEELLLHPIVETFVWLKWRKLRGYFFCLMAFFFIFTLSLTSLSILHYVIKLQDDVVYVCALGISRALMIFSFVPLLVAEALNVFQLQKYYLRDYESGVKWFVFLGTWAVGIMNPGGEWARFAAAVTVLLAWTELLFLLSRCPSWGFYALMFSKVAKNVFKVLSTFTFIIVGFAFSFMILNENLKEPFHNFWHAIVKVLIMMIEPDYGDTFENTLEINVISQAIFVTFVILISIVLMNLMVGLAVSDISILEAQGRTERLAKQIGFLSLLELLVYNDCLIKCLPKCLRIALEKRRCVSPSVIIRPATPLNSVFQQLPRDIRESVLEKVAAQLSKANAIDVKECLQKLDNEAKKHPKDVKKTSFSNSSHLSRDSTVTEKLYDNEIKMNLKAIMKEIAELRNEVRGKRNVATEMYRLPQETTVLV